MHIYIVIMEELINATLTGSDGTIDGVAKKIGNDTYGQAFEFISIDESLHLIIAKDEEGKWVRIGGSDPYFSGWVDELAEQVALQ